MSPAGNTRAQSTPAQLSTELILKVQAQKGRLTLIKELQDNLPSSKEELLEYKKHIDDTFKMFSKVHSYFETVWPADCLDHEYFSNDWYLDAQRIYTSLTREVARLRSSFPQDTASSSVCPDTTPHTKLPDISLPEFKGEYSEWPTFSDLFKSLIIDNSKLSDVERLHYLRGCLKDALAQLIASLPLTGASLSQSWDLLTSRYENKRLIVQSHFDKLFGITTAQKNSSSLNLLITTVSETHKALLNLGVTTTLGDNMMVYHVSKHLDPATREAWELSLGSAKEYPSWEKMSSFLTARVRALERIEAAKGTGSQTLQRTSPRARDQKNGFSSRTAAFAHSPTAHPCDQCKGSHYIVACEQFRRLLPVARRAIVSEKRLCFNCLGRHNVKACRSTQKCKTCAGRHHTMLHDPSHVSSTKDTAQPSTSSTAQ